MNEGSPKFESYERRYLIQKEDVEIHAHRLLIDPVTYLTQLREEFAPEPNDDLYSLDENPAAAASLVLGSLCDYILDAGIDIEHSQLNNFITYGHYTPKGDQAFFELLKSAGYTYEELYAWTSHVLPGAATDDMFMVRQSLTVLKRVFYETV